MKGTPHPKASTTFADRLKIAREAAGLSRLGLGKAAGLSQATVGMLERADHTNPKSETVVVLARILGVTTDWLLTGRGEGPGRAPSAPDAGGAR